MEEVGSGKTTREVKCQKSYFDVLGICCPSEVPLIERILMPLDGIQKVSVVVPSKTVIVVHDSLLISQLQIVKALNQAKLEATIRAYGTDRIINKWPSPYILACGSLLLVSSFKYFFHPLQWLALAAVVVGVPPILWRSIAALRRWTLDINTLLLIAVAGAIGLRDYLEAGFIVFLFTIAEWLETMASRKATAGMSSLMSMAPQKAVLAATGQIVDAQDVKVDTILAVKAGEVIPIDGMVVDGRSEVDESSLTGESVPVAKQIQSLVWAGSLNIDGYISVRTTALAENSAVAKMTRLVEEAQNSRSKTQRLIDSCAKYYTPAVVIMAAGVAVVPFTTRVHYPKHWFQLALVLLVSACPCALVLSTPVATFCALLKAARIGLLVKGGDVLEALAKIRVVAFDKTGTITKGEFTVIEFSSVESEVPLHTLLYWVSSIESKSSHPMASALIDYARSNSIEPKSENVTEFRIYPGEGVYGEIDGKVIYVGNKRIAERASCCTVPNMEDTKEGVTNGYVFSGSLLIGIFSLSDTCRTGSAEAIKELKSLGIKSVMVTGDSTKAAMHAQNQLGQSIEKLYAELLPEDKVKIISELKRTEGPTLMVGDGMNDAPALAMANVGISMGISGSAVAMETSHITLMSNDIRKISKAIRLARRTHRKIIANILFSVITKIGILSLAVAGYPFLWAAVLADVGTCLLVILNSMILLREPVRKEKKCCSSSHKSHQNQKPALSTHCAKGGCKSTSTCAQSTSSCCKNKHDDCHNKESHVENHAIVSSHCAKGSCGSTSTCAQPTSSTCMSTTNCHDIESLVENHAISTCMGKHKCHDNEKANDGTPDCNMESSHEHNTSIGCRSGHHGGDLHEEHLEKHGSCKHLLEPRKECNLEKNVSHRCCTSENKDTDTKNGCSSSPEIFEKREIGGCCRSYIKECGNKDGCCGGATVRLPEIVTE
ncbi:putative inactive cadmium/zinc-transporting ATPase HMA3 [Typha angustifolia]|uniref:putative inactive cadmium/zinc-transporting ATPase HMA3 n=1 Tax=Typha angustifolia TaxID=59011 RepID=UPI003C2E6333